MFVLCVMLVVRNASAEPRGGASLVAGIRAFEKHDYAEAAKQFQAALAKGGLSRAQTLTAYIDLGTTLVALGRTNLAQRAFEEAALIDPRFVVPPHSGRQATSLANQARRKQETLGQYHLDAGVPGEVPPHSPFRVTVELDPEQAALGLMVRVFAQEPDSGKQFETVEPSAPRIDVDIPGDLVTAGVTLALRFELLDAHENRVATLDKSVQVSGVATPGRPGDKTADRTPDKNPGDKTSIDKTPDKTGSDTSGAASAGSDEASATATTNPHETKKPASGDDGDDSGDDASADTGGPWSIPHGSKQYTAARTDKPPKIDGLLDDAIWQTAPKDDRFLSTKSKPYGKPTTEPTVVQIAYDEKNLYVAFTLSLLEAARAPRRVRQRRTDAARRVRVRRGRRRPVARAHRRLRVRGVACWRARRRRDQRAGQRTEPRLARHLGRRDELHRRRLDRRVRNPVGHDAHAEQRRHLRCRHRAPAPRADCRARCRCGRYIPPRPRTTTSITSVTSKG